MAEDTPFGPTVTPEQQFVSQYLADRFNNFSEPLSNSPTTMETAGAIWRQETIIGSLLDIGVYEDLPGSYVVDKSFNPLAFAKENEETYRDVLPFIYSGEFNDVWSPEQFEARATKYRKELEDRRIMQEGTTAGMVVGMGLAFFDLPTLIPVFGIASKASTLARVGRTALFGAGVTASQEVVLQNLRDQRTMMESVYGVAAGGLFGGAIGGLSGVLSKRHVLHPENPNNPLRHDAPEEFVIMQEGSAQADGLRVSRVEKPDGTFVTTYSKLGDDPTYKSILSYPDEAGNTVHIDRNAPISQFENGLPTGTQRPTGRVGPDEAVDSNAGPSTAGAAQVKATEAPEILNIGRLGRLMSRVIPKLRMLQSTSSEVRAVVQKLTESGGVLFKDSGIGKSPGITASDIKAMGELTHTKFAIAQKEKASEIMRLSGGASTRAGLTRQEIKDDALRFLDDSKKVFTGDPRKKVYIKTEGHLQEEEIAALVRMTAMRYDDANPIAEADVKKLKARFGDKGTEKILAGVKTMADDLHAFHKASEDALVNVLEVPPEQLLGKDYVMAHIYLRDAVAADRAGFEEILLRKFLDDPTEDFLNDIDGFGGAITPDEFAVLGKQDITINGVDYTTKTGLAAKVDILESWSGDVYERALLGAEIELEKAIQAKNDSKSLVVEAARLTGKTNTDIKKTQIQKAVIIKEKSLREAAAKKAEQETVKLEKQQIDNELSILVEEQRVGMEAFLDTRTEARPFIKALKEAKEGLIKVNKWQGFYQNISEAYDDMFLAHKAIRQAKDDLQRKPLELAKAKFDLETKHSLILSRLTQKQKGLDDRQKVLGYELSALTKKTDALTKALDEHTVNLADFRAKAKALTARRKETTRQANLDETAAKKAKKQAKKKGVDTSGRKPDKAETVEETLKRIKSEKLEDPNKKARMISRAKGKDAPVHEYVKRLVSDIASGNRLPGSIDAVESSMSNRLKKRQIKWTNDELDELFDRGFMNDDLYATVDATNRELSALIGLKMKYGTTDTIKIVNDAVEAVNEKIRDPNISDRYKRQLETHAKDVKASLTGMFDEYMGRAGPKYSDNNLANTMAWSAHRLRQYAHAIHGPGFMIGSFTDFAQKALVNGYHADSALLMRNAADMFKGLPKSELKIIVTHLEGMMTNNRQMAMNGVEQERLSGGLGQQGSKLNAITSLFGRTMDSLSNGVSIYGAMQWWNTRGKLTALNAMQHHLVKDIGDYEAVLAKATAGDLKAQKLIAKYASFNLDRENMALIKKMIDKYPPVNNNGVLELDWHRWHKAGPDGDQAVKVLQTAMMRNANQAITTPGVGDKPLFMAEPTWKTVFQFQTFGFVAVPKTILPAIQRGLNFKDTEILLYLAHVAALGSMVLVAKDLIRDGKVKERTKAEWGYDIIDRSGLLAFASQPTAALVAVVAELTGIPMSQGRYGDAPITGLLAGPVGGALDNTVSAAQDAISGDGGSAVKNLGRVVPFKIVVDALRNLNSE